MYSVGQKSDTFWYLSFLSCQMYYKFLKFLFTRISFSSDNVGLRLAGVNKFCFMRINCNFVTMVGSANDERCLNHNLRVDKMPAFR